MQPAARLARNKCDNRRMPVAAMAAHRLKTYTGSGGIHLDKVAVGDATFLLLQDVKSYLFYSYQTNSILSRCPNTSGTHLRFLGTMSRPLGRASCQSPKPEGGAEGAAIDSECACQATIGLP